MPWGYTKSEGQFPRVPDVPVLKPEVEHVAGKVFPYRGTEQHGVSDPNIKIDYPDETWPDTTIAAFEEHKPDPEPVPVKIVRTGAREIRDWRTRQTVVTGTPILVVGRNLDRTTVRIRNTSATIVAYIGNTVSVSAISGYPIAANSESIPITTSEEIYGISGDGNPLTLAVLEELAVEVHEAH